MSSTTNAPGWPGIPARWTSSAKNGIGGAFAGVSPAWFTISHGVLNEVYYPRMDQAMIRDAELIVTDGSGFFSEEKRDAEHSLAFLAPDVPAYLLTNKCLSGRYLIEKKVLTDPRRPVVLQHVKFTPLVGNISDYMVHVLLSPHVANRGAGNTGWIGEYKGATALMASRDGYALAMLASVPFRRGSAGFVGISDGWKDLKANKRLTAHYDRAENGNVALTAELDASSSGGEFVLALGFGRTADEAAHQAMASVYDGFESSLDRYVEFWNGWNEGNWSPQKGAPLYGISKVVLKSHLGVYIPGGIIASLSVPWGFSKGDDDLGGYHLVWPRDMVEAAGAFLAIGAKDEALQALAYLEATQESDGHWPQNMWMDGRAYWGGIQMDEAALPILLVDLAFRRGAISSRDVGRFWPMMRRAAGFVVRNGPVSQQDRWEEDPGYTPFTLAAEIAALVVAAEYAGKYENRDLANYLLETADTWNSSIERWIYVTGTSSARELGVEGYYVRISPIDVAESGSPKDGYVPIKNRPPAETNMKATHIISPDALALVRLGLRDAKDPRILNTVKAIDKLLRVDTPTGPSWHRYNDDGYGEHEDGAPFDGTGIGRVWPLLTGERAHYELAKGSSSAAGRLLKALESFAGDGGMLPEQVWDSADIPEKELFFGKPSGSAMPLVWAHAEYVKLVRSLEENAVFDTPPQTVKRYIKEKHGSDFASWRFNHKIRLMTKGLKLRIELLAPAVVHWSADNWKTIHDSPTEDTHLGIHIADIDASGMNEGAKILFTFYWKESGNWEGKDFSVSIDQGETS
jgi:glucoamylase